MGLYDLLSDLTPFFGACYDGNGSEVHKSMLHGELFFLKSPQAGIEQDVSAFSDE